MNKKLLNSLGLEGTIETKERDLKKAQALSLWLSDPECIREAQALQRVLKEDIEYLKFGLFV